MDRETGRAFLAWTLHYLQFTHQVRFSSNRSFAEISQIADLNFSNDKQSEPASSYSSLVSTIRCYAITSGECEDSTFVTWSANFSNDATAEVIQDARYKRQAALANLANSF